MSAREIVINASIDTKCDSWKMFIKYLIREAILPDLTSSNKGKEEEQQCLHQKDTE